MNRKEAIVVGLLLLSSFIGGVFAEPPMAQMLNVFVTNFPQNQQVTVTNFAQNEVRKVFDQVVNTFPPVVFFSSPADVSQFSRVTAFYKVTVLIFGGGSASSISGGFQMGVDPDYPITDSTAGPFDGTTAIVGISHSIDGPSMIVGVEIVCGAACPGSVRVEMTLFLQR